VQGAAGRRADGAQHLGPHERVGEAGAVGLDHHQPRLGGLVDEHLLLRR
jgi:hypothetical protein